MINALHPVIEGQALQIQSHFKAFNACLYGWPWEFWQWFVFHNQCRM